MRYKPGMTPTGMAATRRRAALVLAGAVTLSIAGETTGPTDDRFPPELVAWVPDARNPLLEGTGRGTWDREIRERGFILSEPDGWRLWCTGYDSRRSETKSLGLPGNPIIPSDDSSGILVKDGEELRLYTMHPAVRPWRPRGGGAGIAPIGD
jgi:hypothetical protein